MNEQGEDLDPRLRDSLDALKAVPPRDAQAAARGRGQYLARVDALSRDMARQAERRPRGGWSLFPRRGLAASGLAIVLFLFLLVSGTGITVYAAQDSLPNAPLYPVKLLSEDTQLALTFQPADKMELFLAFADRRVDELVALNNRRVATPETVADRLAQELDSALELAVETPEQGQSQALTRMQTTIRRQQQLLGQVSSHVADPAKPVLARVQASLAEHLSLVELGLTDPPGLQRQIHGAGKPSVPPGQEQRGTNAPPGQEQRPPTAPGKEQRTLTPSGQDQHSGTTPPGQERRATTAPAGPGPSPTVTPTPKTPGGGRGK